MTPISTQRSHAPLSEVANATDAGELANQLAQRYVQVRARTMALVQGLSEADCQAQSMVDASPLKWHLAHVSWFFETFLLERFEPGFKAVHPAYKALFNSYYNGVGAQHPRSQRGLITRPGLAEVVAYRAAVDARLLALLLRPGSDAELLTLVELGLQHEQQHQELMLTDFKHLLSFNPLAPAFRSRKPLAAVRPVALDWVEFDAGMVHIGHEGEGFAFDNETPRHQLWLQPYAVSNRLVTQGEWAEFIADGGYRDPRWWLSAGWDWVGSEAVGAPLYWRGSSAAWHSFTLHGLLPIDRHAPVVHINYFEADAFARWYGAQQGLNCRLPTEAEWEHAAQQYQQHARAAANLAESEAWHPLPASDVQAGPLQMLGDVWEWTSSAYQAYPGYQPWSGAVGEYNGKFMVNQYVLRGGSCATPALHLRTSYRNFFATNARWQFSGLRLARSLG